jgi:uridylate kinase
VGAGDSARVPPAGAEPRYRRILLKLSGEALLGSREFGIDPTVVQALSREIADVHALGVQIGMVLGGGNIFRGVQTAARGGVDRVTGDQMGMLATVMNSLAFQDGLEAIGVETRVLSAVAMPQVAEPFIRRRAIRHLEKGRVVIVGAGTGNPYFTTDTAAALRAMEIGADALVKATKVDAVYAADPLTNPDAQRFEFLAYIDALNMRVGVLDSTAITLCMENNMPIFVVDLWQPHVMEAVVCGERVGTVIADPKTWQHDARTTPDTLS